MGEPFIKLYKKMLKWEWYDDTNTKILFLHILLRANWEAGSWHGIDYEPGEFITSLQTLAVEAHLSIQQVRTGLRHLESTGEITSRQQGNARIITVNNWSQYQGTNKASNSVLTRHQQGANKVLTTDKEYKEIKEYKEVNIRAFAKPTVDEVRAYCQERQNNVDPDKFVDFYESKGWMIGKNKMKDWKSAVRTWERKDKESPKPKNKFNNFDGRAYDYGELDKLAFGE